MSAIVTGVGAAGWAGAGEAFGSGDALGSTGTVGVVGTTGGVLTPTTIASIAATSSIEPIVDTGMFVESDVICPDGKVMLFAARMPVTCPAVRPLSASLAGSSVMVIRCSSPPVRSTVATPSSAWIAGTISSFAIAAAAASPSSVVAASEAMMTGEELMLSALTVGSTVFGSPAFCRFCSICARISLTSEPNENCAMTSESELAEVDWSASRRGTPAIACSIGLVTWSATSAAPAPGSGAMTVITGNSMSGSSSCLRPPQARMPAMNTAPASRSVTLRLLTANSERRLMRDPFAWLRAPARRARRPGVPGSWRCASRRGSTRPGRPGTGPAPRRRGRPGGRASGGR